MGHFHPWSSSQSVNLDRGWDWCPNFWGICFTSPKPYLLDIFGHEISPRVGWCDCHNGTSIPTPDWGSRFLATTSIPGFPTTRLESSHSGGQEHEDARGQKGQGPWRWTNLWGISDMGIPHPFPTFKKTVRCPLTNITWSHYLSHHRDYIPISLLGLVVVWTPLKNMTSSIGMMTETQLIWDNSKNGNQTTNQLCYHG